MKVRQIIAYCWDSESSFKMDGPRTECLIQPGLLKESVASISRLQSIIILTQEGLRQVKNRFRRYSGIGTRWKYSKTYSGIGTRCKYPKTGAPVILVMVRTNINIIEILK